MQTLIFILGMLSGAWVMVCVHKYGELREQLRKRSYEAGVLTERVHTLEMLLKDAEERGAQKK